MALLSWVNSIPDLPRQCETLSDLSDGLIAHAVLRNITPESDLSPLNTDGLDNGLLRVVNIKKVLADVEQFHETVLKNRIDVAIVDASALGREGDEAAAEKLLELLLGCAILCERKNDYIQSIMLLDPASQASLVPLIQKIMASVRPMTPDRSREVHDDDDDDGYSLTSPAPASAVSAAQLRDLETRLAESEQTASARAAEIDRARQELQQMQRELAAAIEEKNRLEAKCNEVRSDAATARQEQLMDELEGRVSELEVENKELTNRLLESEKLAATNRSLQDELDVLRHKVEQIPHLEQRIATMKTKLDQAKDLKQHVATLEQTNSEYLEQNLDLEDQIKRLEAVKDQLESYKEKFTAGEAEKIRLRNLVESLEGELSSSRTSHSELAAEVQTLRSIMRARESSDAADAPAHPGEIQKSLSDSIAETTASVSTSELMKKIARLERENKKLREEQTPTASSSADGDVQSRLEDSARLQVTLEKENKELQARIHSLEQSLSSANTGKVAKLEQLVREQESAVSQLESKLKQALMELDSRKQTSFADSSSKELEEENRRLKARLTAVQSERSKDAGSKQSEFEVSIASLQSQLQEKTSMVDDYTRKMRKALTAQEREQRLISAWIYDLEMDLQKSKLTQRSVLESHPSKGWLGKRRQELLKEPVLQASSSVRRQ